MARKKNVPQKKRSRTMMSAKPARVRDKKRMSAFAKGEKETQLGFYKRYKKTLRRGAQSLVDQILKRFTPQVCSAIKNLEMKQPPPRERFLFPDEV